MPPPPGLFSITTGWPRYLAATSANLRRCVSVVPPGGHGQMSVIGFAGNDCARAAGAGGRRPFFETPPWPPPRGGFTPTAPQKNAPPASMLDVSRSDLV